MGRRRDDGAPGQRLADGCCEVVREAGLEELVAGARPTLCLMFTTAGPDGAPSQEYRTLFLQELLRRGVLGQSFVVSAAHTDDDIDQTVEAVAGALGLRRAVDAGSTEGFLRGRPVAPALRRYAVPRQLPPRRPPAERSTQIGPDARAPSRSRRCVNVRGGS